MVDADPVKLARVVFDGVQQGGRLTEADRDDDVAVGADEFQDVFATPGWAVVVVVIGIPFGSSVAVACARVWRAELLWQ